LDNKRTIPSGSQLVRKQLQLRVKDQTCWLGSKDLREIILSWNALF